MAVALGGVHVNFVPGIEEEMESAVFTLRVSLDFGCEIDGDPKNNNDVLPIHLFYMKSRESFFRKCDVRERPNY